MASNTDANNSKNEKPSLPKKKYRIVNDRVIMMDEENDNLLEKKPRCTKKLTKTSYHESDNSDVDAMDQRDYSESYLNKEIESLSKPECITKECLSFINNVHRSLTNLLDFKKELDQEFVDDTENMKFLTNVFRDVGFLKEAYQMILGTITRLESKSSGFYLYEVLLDSVVAKLLKIYKPFLSQYSFNAKWIGDFSKGNQNCIDACDRARKKYDIEDNVDVVNCFYTAFTSLFSMELMFERYRNCFAKDSEQFVRASEAKNVISNLLSDINTNQDQAEFLKTQQELNLLTGKSKELKIYSRFVHKGIATKFARRDGKPLTRQLVLFTEILYVTLPPGNIVGTSSVRQELSINAMNVEVVSEEDVANMSSQQWGISICAREAVQDFYFDSEHDRTVWVDKLQKVIKEEGKINGQNKRNTVIISLGKEAPRWQKDSAASHCNGYKCSQKFNTTFRRHHCRADGLLYCDSCCSFKVKLDFERAVESRVCELCFHILNGCTNTLKRDDAIEQLNVVMQRKTRTGKTGWLVVKSLDREQQVLVPEGRYFCELDNKDAILKLYEKSEDKSSLTNLILMMVDIKLTDLASSYNQKSMPTKKFTIEHREKKEGYLFKADSQEECQGWIDCIKERISTFENT